MKRWTEIAAAALAVVMALAALGQWAIALLGGYGILLITGALTLLLALPVLMNTARSPEVTVEADGLRLSSAVWGQRRVPFAAIRAIVPDPALPPPGAEFYRRQAVGRRKYRPAEGRLLIIPALPLQYRIAGWFAGEGFTGVIAITTRAHPDYDRLMPQIEHGWAEARAAAGET